MFFLDLIENLIIDGITYTMNKDNSPVAILDIRFKELTSSYMTRRLNGISVLTLG